MKRANVKESFVACHNFGSTAQRRRVEDKLDEIAQIRDRRRIEHFRYTSRLRVSVAFPAIVSLGAFLMSC